MQTSSITSAAGLTAQTDTIEKSRIKNLVKRKQDLLDLKQSYRENSLKQGKSSQDMESKMKEYDSMISDIEQEISKIASKQKRKAFDAEKKDSDQSSFLSPLHRKSAGSPAKQRSTGAQALVSGLSSLQSNSQMVRSALFAQKALHTEVLSPQRDSSFHENPQKYISFDSGVNQSDARLRDLNQNAAGTAKQAEPEAQTDTRQSENNYRQMAIEQYRKISSSLNISQYMAPSRYDITI